MISFNDEKYQILKWNPCDAMLLYFIIKNLLSCSRAMGMPTNNRFGTIMLKLWKTENYKDMDQKFWSKSATCLCVIDYAIQTNEYWRMLDINCSKNSLCCMINRQPNWSRHTTWSPMPLGRRSQQQLSTVHPPLHPIFILYTGISVPWCWKYVPGVTWMFE